MSDASAIRVSSLSKHFGSLRAVDDVSFDVARGEIFGLLGPNGAGKSTAIGCILGQLRPTSGSCAIDGADSWGDRHAAHRSIGVLPSEFAFEDRLTGREMLALFSRLRGIDFPAERAAELAERLHADLDRPQRELSRGNRQKIGLIQALAHDPDIALMDEPTSGLDPLMQEEFLRIVDELRAAGRTVLVSSHYLEEVERACDRVAMIKDGRLFAVEAIKDLLARAPKLVTAEFEGPPPGVSALSAVPGVDHVEISANTVVMRVSGIVDPLVKALAQWHLRDLEIQRPSLEQTFVEMYEGDDGAAGE